MPQLDAACTLRKLTPSIFGAGAVGARSSNRSRPGSQRQHVFGDA